MRSLDGRLTQTHKPRRVPGGCGLTKEFHVKLMASSSRKILQRQSQSRRLWLVRRIDFRHDRKAYKRRNVIARCFGRLKDFRRIATRYDKLAGNFFSALCLVAIVAYWL